MGDKVNSIFSDNKNSSKFQKLFGLNDPLLGDFSCKGLSTQVLKGNCYISYKYFCFCFKTWEVIVKVVIPLKSIEHIAKAVTLKSESSLPKIIPVSEGVKPNVIQILTQDKLVHNFYGFGDYNRVWSVLYYAWQNANGKMPQPCSTSENPQVAEFNGTNYSPAIYQPQSNFQSSTTKS